MGAVRRSIAGLLFGIAFACACLAISGFMLQRTAFDPDRTAASADVVLADSAIHHELVSLISNATASQMYPGDPAAAAVVRQNVEFVAGTKPGAELMAQVLHDAHAHLIGRSDAPVQITPEQMVQVVRDERASALPAITLPVPRIGLLAITDTVLKWLVPISAIVAVLFFVLCFFAHPEKAGLFRTLGFGLLVLAAMLVIFAFVVPRFVPPLLDDSAWTHLPPRLADDALPLTIGAALLLVGLGLALFVSSNRMGRTRRWSTPVSTYRYREERRWS
ncbi:MAG: hypothetical protein RLZZ623_1429 [Actinomycetota bacterium]|jgi:hypothetical protein